MDLRAKKAVIIGAGFGGLALANLLALKGASVEVYERQDYLGGRAGELKTDGFTYDTGPSWYLMPEVYERYFNFFNVDINKKLDIVKLDPAYKAFYEDGTTIEIGNDINETKSLFDSIEAGAGDRLDKYLADARFAYDMALSNFLYDDYSSLAGLFSPSVLRNLNKLAPSLLTNLHAHVSKFFTTQKLQQLMEYPTVFLGASPYNAPSIYRLMSHMDFTQGVFYPKAGMYGLVKQLVNIGRGLGVQYYTSSGVTKIQSDGSGFAKRILLESGKAIEADLFISNADLHFTETQLLAAEDRSYPENYWDKKVLAPSALLIYAGFKGELKQLAHHNLFFIDEWADNFSDIYVKKVWPNKASVYVSRTNITSRTAPEGYENLFFLVPGPVGEISKAKEEELANKYLKQVLAAIGISANDQRVEIKNIYGPQYFKNQFNSWDATGLGLAHTLKQSAFFRPKNKSKKLGNLFYVGANTLPGIGLPMCLIGAEVTLKSILNIKGPAPLKVAKA